jgi:tetratricopeptide (TPR) repeat protein
MKNPPGVPYNPFMNKWSFGLVVLALGGVAQAAEEAAPPIEQVLAQSKQSGKPVIVEFGTTWCKPCKIFETEVLPAPEVKAGLEGMIFVRYDAEAGAGLAAAGRYKVSSYPTFLALDGAGEVRGRKDGTNTGAAGVSEFLAFVGDARKVVADEDKLRADLARSPEDPAVQLAAARWYLARQRTADALRSYDAAAKIAAATPAQRGEAVAAAARLRRIDAWKKQLLAEKLELVRKYPGMPGARKALQIAVIESGLTQPDVDRLVADVIAATTRPDELNELLYVALAAGSREAALAGAKRLQAMSPKDADTLDTVAEVYAARGEREEALRTEDEALALAKGKPSEAPLKKNRDRMANGGESPDAKRVRNEAERTWKRLAALDSDTEERGMPDDDEAPEMSDMRAFMAAENKLIEKASKACAKSAGKLDEAFVRLSLAEAGGPTKAAVVLEPDAGAPLKSCLRKELTGVQLPKPPPFVRGGKQVMSVRFKQES